MIKRKADVRRQNIVLATKNGEKFIKKQNQIEWPQHATAHTLLAISR